jgi:hypothetical protein
MPAEKTFKIGGKEVTLTRNAVEDSVRRMEPGPIRRYSVTINGVRFPIKQVVAAASGQPPAAFIATDAYRILNRLGFEIQSDEPPSPDASFEEFNKGLADFLPAVQDGFDCIVNLASEVDFEGANVVKPEAVIAMLTGSLADDLHDVLVLCSNERKSGALRLLRTPYEKFLYASHISKHPKGARDFLTFDAIQARALLDGIEKSHSYKISVEGQARLEEMFKLAQQHFKKTKCKECGESGPRMWTKVTPEQMSKEAGLESLHAITYRYSTLMIHPSFRGLTDQMKDTFKMPAILFAVYRLTLETLKLQWTYFKKNDTATGRTADVMRHLYEVASLVQDPSRLMDQNLAAE